MKKGRRPRAKPQIEKSRPCEDRCLCDLETSGLYPMFSLGPGTHEGTGRTHPSVGSVVLWYDSWYNGSAEEACRSASPLPPPALPYFSEARRKEGDSHMPSGYLGARKKEPGQVRGPPTPQGCPRPAEQRPSLTSTIYVPGVRDGPSVRMESGKIWHPGQPHL